MTDDIKVEYFDNFKCLADQCPFTCCQGWEISIDPETYSRWMEEKSSDYKSGACIKKRNKKPEYFLKMYSDSGCTFLDDKGLCSLVKERGEAYQPKTCREFPRLSNSLGEKTECSLSFTCSAVVDIISGFNRKVNFTSEDRTGITNKSSAFILRTAMLDILQNGRWDITDKLLIIFHLLLSVRENKAAANEIIYKYRGVDYHIALVNVWKDITPDSEASYMEINDLFLDITMNYRKVDSYKKYLEDIYESAEGPVTKEMVAQWSLFKGDFGTYGLLIENIFASKIFSECVYDDIEQMIITFQKLTVEYLMIGYSVFLKGKIDRSNDISFEDLSGCEDRINYELLRDYIVVYSRIIGYNEEGMKEFWKESFDEAVWDFGYLLLLLI